MKYAWRFVLVIAAGAAVVTGVSPVPIRAVGFVGLGIGAIAAAIMVVRRPDGSARRVIDVARSPWLLLSAGMGLALAGPALVLAGTGPAIPVTPVAGAVSAVSHLLLLLGMLGLVGRRTPGQASDLLLGAALPPAGGFFVVWIVLLELEPKLLGLGPLVVTVGLVRVAFDVSMAVAVVALWRFDDETRPVLGLTAAAFGLLTVTHALELIQARFGGTTDLRWATAAALAAAGVWLAASLHPAMLAAVPNQPNRPRALGHLRGLLVGAAVLLGGPALVFEYAEQGSIRHPLWVAAGSVAMTGLVVEYLLRLARRSTHLEHLAHHDELTGLPNRKLYLDRLRLALARSRGTEPGLAVLYADLDRFKQINDSLGHGPGNLVLQMTAARLTKIVGDHGLVARIGGDEFAVFLPDPEVLGENGLARICHEIVLAFEQPFAVHKEQCFVTISVGVAQYPVAGKDPETLIKNADAAMYKAKRRGRDTFEIYTPDLNSSSHEYLTLETSLHRAIERGEPELYYQPKVALGTGSIVGVEALVRWNHPQRGLLHPSAFIPLAEQSGLIVRLDEWSLERACEQAQAWQEGGFPPFAMAVNLSARHFTQRRVSDMVASVLRRTGLDPTCLELELTESLAQDDPGAVRATLLDLKQMGVHCSIDDFGTGFSALSSLATLPIDRLKIDKSFVDRIAHDHQGALVLAVIALAHGLDLEVTAEGVETVPQFEFLRDHGCDVMQGYLFSRPLPQAQLETVLMLEQVGGGPGRLVLASQRAAEAAAAARLVLPVPRPRRPALVPVPAVRPAEPLPRAASFDDVPGWTDDVTGIRH